MVRPSQLVSNNSLQGLYHAHLTQCKRLLTTNKFYRALQCRFPGSFTSLYRNVIKACLKVSCFHEVFFRCLAILCHYFRGFKTCRSSIINCNVMRNRCICKECLNFMASARPQRDHFNGVALFEPFSIKFPFAKCLRVGQLISTRTLRAIRRLLQVVLMILISRMKSARVKEGFRGAYRVCLSMASPIPIIIPRLATMRVRGAITHICLNVQNCLTVFRYRRGKNYLRNKTQFRRVTSNVAIRFMMVTISNFRRISGNLCFSNDRFRRCNCPSINVSFLRLIRRNFFTSILRTCIRNKCSIAAICQKGICSVRMFVRRLLAINGAISSFRRNIRNRFGTIANSRNYVNVRATRNLNYREARQLFALIMCLFIRPTSMLIRLRCKWPLNFLVLGMESTPITIKGGIMIPTLRLPPLTRVTFRNNNASIQGGLVGPSASKVRVNFPSEVLTLLILFTTLLIPFTKRRIRVCFVFQRQAYRRFTVQKRSVSPIKLRHCVLFCRTINCVIPMLSLDGRGRNTFRGGDCPRRPRR